MVVADVLIEYSSETSGQMPAVETTAHGEENPSYTTPVSEALMNEKVVKTDKKRSREGMDDSPHPLGNGVESRKTKVKTRNAENKQKKSPKRPRKSKSSGP